MRNIVGLAVIAGLGLLTLALTEASKAGAAETGSPGALVTKADEMGYDLQSVRERHGLYHANLLDRQTGGAVHAEFRTDDGELMSARMAANGKDRDAREHDDHGRSRHTGERHDREDDRD